MSPVLTTLIAGYCAAGVVVSIFLVARELSLASGRRPVNPHLFIAVLAAGLQLRLNWLIDGTVTGSYFFFGTGGSMMVIGAIQYLIVLHTFDLFQDRLRQSLLHLLPFFVMSALEFVYTPLDPVRFFDPADGDFILRQRIGALCSVSWNILYFVAILRILKRERSKYQLDYNRDLYLFFGFPFTIVFVGATAILLRQYNFLVIVSVAMTTGVLFILWTLMRRPDFFEAPKFEIESQKYKKTQITGIDVPALKTKIQQLMQTEELYKDDDLRVQDLAASLGITSNQLSRIINEEYGKNFYQFMNGYRIEAAWTLLRSETKMNALQVALAVGYNSKSAFYKNFTESTGLTPAQYRKQ